MKICAIVPIKHISTRVNGKNYRMMNGKPLFHYILETLLKVERISKIIVDTNSELIKKEIIEKFDMDKIMIYDRPEHLWEGSTSTNTLIHNLINNCNLEYDLFIQTHVTNPLLKVDTINNAIDKFLCNTNDSLFTVKRIQARLYDMYGNTINHDKFKLIQTQDLDPIYEENSCLYIFKKYVFNKLYSRIGQDPILFEMSSFESQDIDTEFDFVLTEQMMKINDENK